MNLTMKLTTCVFGLATFSNLLLFTSCEEFVKIDAPRTDLIRETVFADEATAKSALFNVYYQMQSGNFSSGGIASFSLFSALSSDELRNYNTNGGSAGDYEQFYKNQILISSGANTNFWSELYQYIYKANSILEGLASSSGLSDDFRKQLEGQAKFIRAFSHFYLVNLYGDVPLATTTDYIVNQNSPRTPKAQVYERIIADLVSARDLLTADYSFSSNERVCPNRGAATALLARVYLYTGDWVRAEEQATSVINNKPLYILEEDLDNVFVKNSDEAIWQLWTNTFPLDLSTFYVDNFPGYGALQNDFVESFESDDQRKQLWIGKDSVFYFPTKYKSAKEATEYSMVLRLSEQYLIRAEARAIQNKLTGSNSSASDINTIRDRAGLDPTLSTTQADLLNDVMRERGFELFTEWGHRWLDLKRTDRVNDVMSLIKPNTWTPTAALYPIPQSQRLNSLIPQNPGYPDR